MSRQTTLKAPINCTGTGLHSGQRVNMTLAPAPAGTGIVFRRTDLVAKGATDEQATIPARWDQVVDTRLCTVVGNAYGAQVGTVEHLMSALRGCGIDNLRVDLDGPEVPIMDGSAAPFVFLVECAGRAVQTAPRRHLRILREVRVEAGDKSVALMPAPVSSFRVEIDFSTAAIRRQEGALRLGIGEDDRTFKAEVARARTFGFLHEVDMMRKAGLARGGSLENAVVIDGDRIVNEGGLRFGDEFVRHKILDAVGDLYMAGAPIIGHFHGVRPGHEMNNRLLRALFADVGAFRWEETVPARPLWDDEDEPLAAIA
ncbi:UDP-3-O-acyl-N-acetylglucosamine deacetylase [Rhodocista pekingensis]|uniref:UDP-3-O-acyl-N-acetylglucosamine deacetylase n=1 Tax=Rhodocista pekingensis TaxID=201185 RepID=A0ABW2KXQ5_9PROT